MATESQKNMQEPHTLKLAKPFGFSPDLKFGKQCVSKIKKLKKKKTKKKKHFSLAHIPLLILIFCSHGYMG